MTKNSQIKNTAQPDAAFAKAQKRAAVILPAAAAGLIAIIFLLQIFMPAVKYKKALALMDDADYAGACALLNTLDYKDSALLAEKCAAEAADALFAEQAEQLHGAEVGDEVYLGSYEQDNNEANGKEPIAWLVLAKDKGRVLLISKYALDARAYNTEYRDITWAECSLRKWLNTEFIDAAFTGKARDAICKTAVHNADNPQYGTEGGADTTDRIFLLSIDEANRYFSTEAARATAATAYAQAKKPFISDGGNSWWWLRSPGYYACGAANVSDGGMVYNIGGDVDHVIDTVRPAMWVEIGE